MVKKHCINTKSQEFLDLLSKTNLEPIELAAEASLWQDKNNTDELPPLDYFKDYIKDSEPVVKSNELSTIVDKVKLFLEKKLAIIKNREIKNKTIKENQIKRILDNIKALDGVESINIFIEDAYNKLVLAETQFDNLIKNKDNLSNHEMIEALNTFNEVANGYSILDEISKEDTEQYFSKPIKGLKEESSFTTQDKLTYSLVTKEKIKQRYLNEGLPLLADYLLQQKSTSLDTKTENEIKELESRIKSILKGNLSDDKKIARIKDIKKTINKLKGFSLDKESLVEQLKAASKDESTLDFLFSPLISSDDSVLALFAKSIKNTLEDARLKDIEFAKKADKAFNNFAKESGKNKNNVSKFNEGIYEEIEVPIGKDKDGNTIYRKEKAFVQKYDVTSYEKAKNEFFKELGPKPILTEDSSKEDQNRLKKWKKDVATWFSLNTQAKPQSEIDDIIAGKEQELKTGIITKEEYNTWINRNMSFGEDGVSYKGELTEPSVEYINKNWLKLYAEDGVPISPQGKYHKFLVNKYFEDQKLIPENFRRGYRLPSIQKDSSERLQTEGVINLAKTRLKESTQIQAYDTEFGLAGLTEEDIKFLPVYYTQNIDSDDVSTDLISSVMRFSSMVNRYKALNDINGEIALTKAVIGERKVISTNIQGEKIIDAFAKKMGYHEYIRQNGESYSKKHLDAFIDMVVNGEMQKAEEIFGLDAGKVTNTLLNYSAVTTIALDLLKGVSNNIQGNIQLRIEASSKEFFDKKNLLNGKKYYINSVPSFLSEFNNISPQTLPTQLLELYDAFQGSFKDNYGRDISGSVAKKLFRTNTLFLNQNIGEHEIQASALFAILDATKVTDKEGKEISLLEAYNKYGIDKVVENTDFTEDKRKDLQNTLHALNKRLQGVYNEFDKGTAQRYSLGRLAVMYRKHLIPGYKRRFKKLSADQELGSFTEGYYRTFWNSFIRDLRDFKFNIVDNWSTYTNFEKKQIRRTLTEATFILALTTLVMVLKNLGDDDEKLKKNYAYNFLLYEATRLRSETSSYISPLDAYRTIKSPSAMTGTLDRTIKFTDQLIFTWNPEKLQYKRKSGIWDKGDNKSFAYFLKLMGFSGYNLDPSAATEAFNSTLNK